MVVAPTDRARFETEAWPGNLEKPRPTQRALVIPGGDYSVDHPLLFWSCQILAAAGWHVQTVRWTVDQSARQDPVSFVEAAVELAAAAAPKTDRTLVLAKSFGTYAAGWADDHEHPGVWLTPVMTSPLVAGPLARYRQPALVVAGTADPLWDGKASLSRTVLVREIKLADHALHVGSDWRASLAALSEAMACVDTFARTLQAA